MTINTMKKTIPLLIASLLVSCDVLPPAVTTTDYAFGSGSYAVEAKQTVSDGYWDKPEGLTGAHKIVVDIAMQNAKYYIGSRQVGYTTVSTGKEGKATPRRTYRVLGKDIDHRSSKYGSVEDSAGNVLVKAFVRGEDSMPAGGRFIGSSMFYGLMLNTTGIWMHEGIVTSAPESAGCIRVPTNMAKVFYENIPVGATVIVK